jgi:hypothetical protein
MRDSGHIFVAPGDDIVPLLAHPVPGLNSMATLKASLIASIIGIQNWLLRLTQEMRPKHP